MVKGLTQREDCKPETSYYYLFVDEVGITVTFSLILQSLIFSTILLKFTLRNDDIEINTVIEM